MRTFIAINLPKELKEKIIRATGGIPNGNGLRKVSQDNIHMTLKFLGDIDSAKIQVVKDALRKIHSPTFKVSIGGHGFFPDSKHIKVVWLGLCRGREEVIDIQWKIDIVLSTIGIKKERGFEPHLTIARANDLKDSAVLVQRLQGLEFVGEFEVESFDLMESTLKPGGPEYRISSMFLLGKMT